MLKPVIEGRIRRSRSNPAGARNRHRPGFSPPIAHLAGHVTSVEQHADLADAARAKLARAGIDNARVVHAEAFAGFDTRERFDVVVLTGAVYALPERARQWVKPGGRLFAITGASPAMQALLHTRVDETHWQTESLFDTDIPIWPRQPPKRFTPDAGGCRQRPTCERRSR